MSLAPKLIFCCSSIVVMTGIASAQSLTGNVGSAGVTSGEQAAEFRVGIDDTGLAQSRIHYEQAFSDCYQLRAIVLLRRDDGEAWDYSGFTVENWFQWAEEQSDGAGFHGGLRLAYTFADGTADDEFNVRLALTDRFASSWEWRANIIAGFETGNQRTDGADLQSRLQITKAVPLTLFNADKWRFGAELFSEYGNSENFLSLEDQAHQIGPVVKTTWRNGIYMQVGFRSGLTDGSDDYMGKFFVGREF
ncbi:hypothetical protein [Hyphomonas sp.]|uniref:hypothetical protein n=1 Tax=Hyphomonas sp. TaxID=87 RepID=UPI0032EC4A2E